MSYPPGTEVKLCVFCKRPLASKEEWLEWDIDEKWKRLCIHVWQHHDETHLGISLKETLANGPQGEEEGSAFSV